MPWKRCLNKRDSVYLYIIDLCTELDRFCLLAPYDRAYVITVNTDNTVTDFPTFKEFLFLYKNLSDYGKPFLIILCICEWRAVFSVNVIPLYDEFFQESNHATFQHPCPWDLPLSFLAIGQIGYRNIRIFVTGTSYTKISTMLADMPIEPFDPFPKELHVRRKTHMTFITCDIGHTHVKILKIRLPVWGKDSLKEVNVKTGCNLITDSTDYLVVRYRAGRGYHDTTEQLIVYVSVKMFYQ